MMFLDQDTPQAMYDAAGLNALHIVAEALAAPGMWRRRTQQERMRNIAKGAARF